MAAQENEGAEQALARQAARQREIEHRVKNTLQLISSIVLLQSRRAGDESARAALKGVQQRVAAVSVAHRHVGWNDDAELVELPALIREIVGDLAGSAGREGVAIDLDLEPMAIAGRQAAPVALLLSEAVGNCLRHAFPEERPGRITVSLRRLGAAFQLEIIDDGVGMTAGAAPSGFGLTLIQLMAQQLRGRLDVAGQNGGVRVTVDVPQDAT